MLQFPAWNTELGNLGFQNTVEKRNWERGFWLFCCCSLAMLSSGASSYLVAGMGGEWTEVSKCFPSATLTTVPFSDVPHLWLREQNSQGAMWRAACRILTWTSPTGDNAVLLTHSYGWVRMHVNPRGFTEPVRESFTKGHTLCPYTMRWGANHLALWFLVSTYSLTIETHGRAEGECWHYSKASFPLVFKAGNEHRLF